MDTPEQISDALREFIRKDLGLDTASLPDGEPLLSVGRLDSLGLLELVAFIEHRFGIAVSPTHLTLDHFDSIASITAFVTDHRGL